MRTSTQFVAASAGCLVAMLAFQSWAQSAEPKAPGEDETWIKAEGSFGVQLLLVDNPDEFQKRWLKPGRGVNVTSIDKVARNKPVGVFIIFAGAKPKPDGQADVVADIVITKPNGDPYAEEKGLEVWQKKPAPRGKAIQLGADLVILEIEDADLSGKYEIRATVRDRVANIELKPTRTFEVPASK